MHKPVRRGVDNVRKSPGRRVVAVSISDQLRLWIGCQINREATYDISGTMGACGSKGEVFNSLILAPQGLNDPFEFNEFRVGIMFGYQQGWTAEQIR